MKLKEDSAKQASSGSGIRRLFFWATVASGVAAAFLMIRRGESLGTIARKTITNPIGTLVTELKTVV